jgi:cysteine-rich repeat protein
VCGNGWIEGAETCDDGNLVDADGCSRTCVASDSGYPRCGDGEVQADEQCDSGELNSNLEPGACRTNCRLPSCGDGVLDPEEACDDGNGDDRDGCTWKCAVSVCGNGTIEAPEECDVGADNSDEDPNACRTVCRKPWCGDGVTDAGEECDDANADETDGCLKTCTLLCPDGSSKIQGRCIVLAPEETCGALCKAHGAWESFVDWLFGLFA